MTSSTGEFAIAALAKRDVQPLRSSTAKAPEQRHTLSEETKPLHFSLTFATGERLGVDVSGSGEEPTSFWYVMDAFKRLAQLTSSWDSYGAKPLNASAVRRSFSLLPALLPEGAPEPTVVPTRDGGVQFEWHRSGVDLEIKVPPSGPIAYFFADATVGEEREWEGLFDRAAIRQAFERIGQLA